MVEKDGLPLIGKTAEKCILVGVLLVAVCLSQAFEVRQVFREERFTRGNVNLRRIQAADDADRDGRREVYQGFCMRRATA